ncbi:MAG: type II secretion system F family protein, partial [Proteocatella sp.]
GYLVMILGLKRKIIKRNDVINMQLPEVMDLLSVSVEAGLGFDQAIKEVVETFKGPLIDELNTTKREMQLGRTKRAALMEMADRCQVEELSLFVSAVVQGEQFGISLKNILRTQSFSIRLRQRQRIEEKAAKLPVKIILPVAIFIFPVLFIVVLGPTMFNLMKSLAGF